nr:Chain A, LR10 peptide from Cysteine Deleted Protegrin-1 [unidentified]
LYRRRFVVGR